ncbi:hypothetical protein EDB92DRAFT_592845 [Lactarius akahatsu]|uniref:Uncharacterized protein n=1 Tax=Lactarius akahatsu TaxID=416441 RepID=A0AAD4LM24_9AGAM|nr:hypothetical protein EDB92DRAFT_592845 [Lactarius akahatsu]
MQPKIARGRGANILETGPFRALPSSRLEAYCASVVLESRNCVAVRPWGSRAVTPQRPAVLRAAARTPEEVSHLHRSTPRGARGLRVCRPLGETGAYSDRVRCILLAITVAGRTLLLQRLSRGILSFPGSSAFQTLGGDEFISLWQTNCNDYPIMITSCATSYCCFKILRICSFATIRLKYARKSSRLYVPVVVFRIPQRPRTPLRARRPGAAALLAHVHSLIRYSAGGVLATRSKRHALALTCVISLTECGK